MAEEKTTDMALAAFLLVDGGKLVRLDGAGGRHFEFIIECQQDARQAIQRFWGGAAQVEPGTYFNAVRHLKGEIVRAGAAAKEAQR